jgi:hypothetical protein
MGEIYTYPPQHLFEAEGKLILYLPHLCLYRQLSFSLGVMFAQLLGFGMGGNLSLGDCGPVGGVLFILLSCFFSQCSLCL